MASLPAYAVETAVTGWLVLGVPVAGRLRYRMLRRDPAALPGGRVPLYRRMMTRQWLLALAAAAGLMATGVPRADIGLSWRPGTTLPLLPALVELVAVGLVVVAVLRWQAARHPDRPWSLRLLRPVRALLPHGRAERRWFAAVAVSAGVTEELLYRGVVTLWVSDTWPGIGFGGAIVASSVAFGLAHAYQGPAGVVLTGAAGYAFGVMYGATASLVVPMAVHALVDLRVLLVLPRPVRGRRIGPAESPFRAPSATPEVDGTST